MVRVMFSVHFLHKVHLFYYSDTCRQSSRLLFYATDTRWAVDGGRWTVDGRWQH